MAHSDDNDTYGIGETGSRTAIPAPALDYRPPKPRSSRRTIAVVGCGGISEQHLTAYRNAGWTVAALCDIDSSKARAARDRFFPDAAVHGDWEELVGAPGIDVVDLTVHPRVRDRMFEPFIDAGQHILSQKPFVTEIARGEELAAKAAAGGVKLAVNQNGRWAPHFAYIGALADGGYLGELQAVRHSVSWDHRWIKGTPFEDIRYLVLYDFGIHWFDVIARLMQGRRALSVHARAVRATGQEARPPFLSSAVIEFDGAQASVDFNADTRFGQEDRTIVIGTTGSARSVGVDLTSQEVVYSCEAGEARPALEGTWFPDGFAGTMGELLCAVEENREPSNGAADNLRSLKLCFAAVKSAETGRPVDPNEPGLSLVK